MTETFRATTQYRDWHGTVSADDAHEGIRNLVRAQERGRNAFVVGVTMDSYESLGVPDPKPFVYALVIEAASYEQAAAHLKKPGPVHLRKVRLDLTLPQFFDFFKRFAIALSHGGLDLSGRECEYEDEPQ